MAVLGVPVIAAVVAVLNLIASDIGMIQDLSMAAQVAGGIYSTATAYEGTCLNGFIEEAGWQQCRS